MPYFIKDFLNNPAGKGATFLNIGATKKQFTERYDKIVKQIHHRVFSVKDDMYILVNIPSSVEGIEYDILVKFSPLSKSGGESIYDMDMQIFSNSPSFLYTYCNAYNKYGLLIKECKKKISSKMLKDIAKQKNPYGVLSYDFSIFAALFYIVANDYTNLSQLKSEAIKCKISDVLKFVKDAELLQKERKNQKDYNRLMEQEEMKLKKKVKFSSEPYTEKQGLSDSKAVKSVKNIKSTKTTKKVKTVKSIKKK